MRACMQLHACAVLCIIMHACSCMHALLCSVVHDCAWYVLCRHHQFRKDNGSLRKGGNKGGAVLATDPQTPGYPPDKTFSLDIDDVEPRKAKKPSAARKVSNAIQSRLRVLINPNQKGPGLQGVISYSVPYCKRVLILANFSDFVRVNISMMSTL